MPMPSYVDESKLVPDPSGRADHVYYPPTDEAIKDPETVEKMAKKFAKSDKSDAPKPPKEAAKFAKLRGMSRNELIEFAQSQDVAIEDADTEDTIIEKLKAKE